MNTPSRLQWLKCAANPLNSTAGYALPHLVVICVIAIAAFSAGVFTATKYDRAFYEQHYRFPGLRQPSSSIPAPLPGVRVPTSMPSSASIDVGRYPAVGDQGPIGSCAAWASAWALSYEYRAIHPKSWLRFSARCLYDHYSNAYNHGRDGGSWPDNDLELVPTQGVPRFNKVPYGVESGGRASFAVDSPDPTDCRIYGVPYKLPIHVHALTGFSQGAGQTAVDMARETLAGINTTDGKAHPIMVALPVYPEYDNATAQPLIVSPSPGESSRGGHANVILAYDDNKVFPDGTHGGFQIQNQWATHWGLGGRAWISYDFAARYTFGMEYITIGAGAPKAGTPPRFKPNPAPPHLPPGTTSPVVGTPPSPGIVAPGAANWYVHNVPGYAHGRYSMDLAPLINYWGDKYHYWPVAIAAMVYTESGGDIYAYRWIGSLDRSCGLAQQIVANIASYIGIQDEYQACQWEYNPSNSIYLGARMLSECDSYHGHRVPMPYAYVFYNGGCGLSDDTAFHPYGDYYAHLQGFIANYNYALSHWMGGGPSPRPKPKPAFNCGKKIGSSHTYGKGRGIYYKTKLQRCFTFVWPHLHWAKKTVRR